MLSKPDDLLSYLRGVLGAWRNDPRSDDELLARFTQHSDEEAFKALVWRHGQLVWRSCTRVLGEGPDAEDAFQSTFLALARKASRFPIKNLGGWLHQVARQAALNAEAGAHRRQRLEQQLQAAAQPELEVSLGKTELYAALDEELASLPEQLRVPLVLRYLEDKTLEEVARIVGCSRPVVSKRLIRGEAILRKRLERRGLAVGIGSVAVLLGGTAGTSTLQARLITSTTRVVLRSLSFPSPFESSEAAALAEGVMKTMGVAKVKVITVLLGVTLCLAGGGLLAYQALAENAAESPQLADEPRGEAEAPRQPGAAARIDCFGDPLPAHALARMGTTRLYYHGDRLFPSRVLAFSPDGKTLATHIDGMTVCLWDAATGKEIRRLTTKAVKGGIASLGFSPDGETLVAVTWEQTVCWWEVATGKFLRQQEYQGPKRDNVWSPTVAFLPDGKMLGVADFQMSAQEERGMYVWDAATGKEIRQLGGPKKRNLLGGAAFSQDGKLLATAVEAKRKKEEDEKKTIISLWDIATGKDIRQLTEDGDVKVIAFSRDGKTLASTDNKKIYVWEVATGKPIHLFEAEAGLLSRLLIFSPDGKTLLGGGAGHLWDVVTGKEIRSFVWKDADAYVALFSPDGKVLAMGDEAGAIRLWEVATGKEIGPRKRYRGCIQSVVYSPDGKTLASMGGDETVRLWEAATGKEMRPLAKHTWWGSRSIAYSPDGKMLVSMEVTALHLWDTATGKEIRQFKVEIPMSVDWPKSAAFSPDGKKLAAFLEGDKAIHLWEVATGKQVYTLPTGFQSNFAPESLAFSPDGRLLAAPGKESTVSLWEVATGQLIGQLGGLKQPAKQGDRLFVRYLAFSPDGRMLATSSWDDDKIHLWEVVSGKEIWQLDGLKDTGFRHGYTLAFHPDGRILATAAQGPGGDSVVRLWGVASCKEIGQLTGHQSVVRSVVFSPDGKTLASGSDDLTCLVWDLTFLGRLKPLPAPSLAPRALPKEQLEAAWADLAKDPTKAYAAVRVLQAVPAQAIPLLRARVRPVAPLADPQQLQRWIADLDDNSFTVREKAQREIEKLGEVAGPALRQALKGQPALEVKRRLQALLAESEPKMVGASPRRLRELRAVHVLESIGTPEVRQVLQALAKGVAGARLTVEAEAALAHLAKHSAAKP